MEPSENRNAAKRWQLHICLPDPGRLPDLLSLLELRPHNPALYMKRCVVFLMCSVMLVIMTTKESGRICYVSHVNALNYEII